MGPAEAEAERAPERNGYSRNIRDGRGSTLCLVATYYLCFLNKLPGRTSAALVDIDVSLSTLSLALLDFPSRSLSLSLRLCTVPSMLLLHLCAGVTAAAWIQGFNEARFDVAWEMEFNGLLIGSFMQKLHHVTGCY